MELKTKTITKDEQVLEITESELINAMADASAELAQQFVEETNCKNSSSVEIIALVTSAFSSKLINNLFKKEEEN